MGIKRLLKGLLNDRTVVEEGVKVTITRVTENGKTTERTVVEDGGKLSEAQLRDARDRAHETAAKMEKGFKKLEEAFKEIFE